MKTFLVPLLGIPEDRETLLNAIEVARIVSGHVTALLPEQHVEVARKLFAELTRECALKVATAPVISADVTVELQVHRGTMNALMRESAIYQDALLLAHSTHDANNAQVPVLFSR